MSDARYFQITDIINYWLPAKWKFLDHWLEVKQVEVYGDAESGGTRVSISVDDGDVQVVDFPNNECWGDSPLTVELAQQKVYLTLGV